MRKFTKATTVFLAVCASALISAGTVNAAASGWVTSGSNTYYHDAAGNKTLGWLFLDGSWYYFGKSTGAMQTGNVTDNGHLYYIRDNGRMATGTVRHPEGNYTYDESGALNTTPGWHKINGFYYYFTDSDTVLTSAKTPDGYYVNEYGQWIENLVSRGIDVSRYQNTIDWQAVKTDDVSFAMIRIGSVKYGVDAMFHTNMVGANKAGLRVGAYVYSYATTVEQAIAEANFAIRNLQNYTVSFPIAIDIESTSQKAKSPAELAAIANAFCSTIEAAGYYPIVYSSKSWFAERIDTNSIKYDLWVAQYNSVCTYDRYDMWQASSKGRVNGIEGNVDINYLYKDYFNIIPQNGWTLRDGKHYYLKNHKLLTGFQTIDGANYYFDSDGSMQTGWILLDNRWFYFNTDGSMARGWINDKDKWYYLDPLGIMQTGWINLSGTIYYLAPDGSMLTGWQTIDGGRYYFAKDGSLAKEWLLIDNSWYYFNKDTGAVTEGWLLLDDIWYYLTPGTGEMLAGRSKVIDGVRYKFDPQGRLIS